MTSSNYSYIPDCGRKTMEGTYEDYCYVVQAYIITKCWELTQLLIELTHGKIIICWCYLHLVG